MWLTVQQSNCPHTPSEIAVFADFIWTELVRNDPEFEIRIKSPTASKDKKNSKKKAQANTKPFALSTPTSIFSFLRSIWKTVFSEKNKYNPPVKPPKAWPCSQKQITSFGSALTVWSLLRVTCTAMHWTHLWVTRWGNSLPETVCCSLGLADPTCFNQHNDDSPPPHAYCAGETLLKCGACLFFDIARWLSRTSWSLPCGCFSEQPLVVAPVQGNWWKLGAHLWRISRTIKV